jgi:signal transduction histidine kinase/ActR/RegA family two-component response regulator
MRNYRVYTILGATILSLIVVSLFILSNSIRQQQEDGTIINYAGQQRTLSQQIAKNSVEILYLHEKQADDNLVRNELNRLIKEWKANHNTLINGTKELNISKRKSETTQKFYNEIQPIFDVITANAEGLVVETDVEKIQLHAETILTNEPTYLSKMNEIVANYESEFTAKIKKLKNNIYWISIFASIIFASILYFFIRPILRKSYDEYQKYHTLSDELKNKNREIDVIKSNVESKNRQLQRKNEIFSKQVINLEESRNQALLAVTTKSEFLSNMSHEIRTPLNAIIGVANILNEDNPRPDQAEHLDTLLFSSENLMVIINDILDYSKIEAGKVKFEKINFSLNRIIHGIHKTLIATAEKKNIKFKYTIQEGIPETYIGDPVRLSQIILNLAGNAIKFTEAGQVDIRISQSKVENGKATLNFAVEDTGIGIPDEKQKIIFDSFSQANSKTTRLYGGTGLGLAITRQLLEMQGSKIELMSVEGEGSTFYFQLTLPIGKAMSKKAVSNRKTQSFNSHNKVLLVDDNAINVVIAKRFLNKWKLEVDVATNGQEAVDMVAQTDYGLVLMDISMPVMDGYEATKLIRSMEADKYQLLPIVALTASVFDALKYQAIEVGMNDYLSKPFKPQALYNMIEKYIITENFS